MVIGIPTDAATAGTMATGRGLRTPVPGGLGRDTMAECSTKVIGRVAVDGLTMTIDGIAIDGATTETMTAAQTIAKLQFPTDS